MHTVKLVIDIVAVASPTDRPFVSAASRVAYVPPPPPHCHSLRLASSIPQVRTPLVFRPALLTNIICIMCIIRVYMF